MPAKMNYYLYRHIRLDKNEPFYIGIGTKSKDPYSYKHEYSRAFDRTSRSKFWKKTVEKADYEVEIMLESDNYEFIKKKEIEFIKLYGRRNKGLGTLCNLTDGGDGVLGLIMSKEAREKNSKSNKGRQSWNKGGTLSQETKNKISISTKLKMKNKEIIDKIKIAHSISVIQFDKNNNFIKEWNSIREAGIILNLDNGSIIKVCKGKRASCGNYIWKYKNKN